ncbi:hypothetical protein LEP3755_61660 [Leptolyngbya sp. NIES-3755]|nr:hypothetical protein LEP3755_61660 [Leptolyngbya sp. NIES-3755]
MFLLYFNAGSTLTSLTLYQFVILRNLIESIRLTYTLGRWRNGNYLSGAIGEMGYRKSPEQASPKFMGDRLPQPPQQFALADVPETSIPSEFVSASMKLFEQGLADPRGCKYRTIVVGTGDCWQADHGLVIVNGWVLPAEQPFAVGWNGLVYPVVGIGAVADLEADINQIVLNAQSDRDKFAGYREQMCVAEYISLSHQAFRLIKVCLLLQLGRADLAEQLWTFVDEAEEQIDQDFYWMLANQWLWTLFDRAICAHLRGDDRLVLVDLPFLLACRQSVETEARSRGINLLNRDRLDRLYYLNRVPELLADHQRRANQPKVEPALKFGLENYASRSDCIAALIHDLEEVFAPQGGQPSYPSFYCHPVIEALANQGEAALELLLQCLEQDTRLTRTVHIWRDFSPSRSVLGVHEAAYAVIVQILGMRFYDRTSSGSNLTGRGVQGRRIVAARIREYMQLGAIGKRLYKLQGKNKQTIPFNDE